MLYVYKMYCMFLCCLSTLSRIFHFCGDSIITGEPVSQPSCCNWAVTKLLLAASNAAQYIRLKDHLIGNVASCLKDLVLRDRESNIWPSACDIWPLQLTTLISTLIWLFLRTMKFKLMKNIKQIKYLFNIELKVKTKFHHIIITWLV